MKTIRKTTILLSLALALITSVVFAAGKAKVINTTTTVTSTVAADIPIGATVMLPDGTVDEGAVIADPAPIYPGQITKRFIVPAPATPGDPSRFTINVRSLGTGALPRPQGKTLQGQLRWNPPVTENYTDTSRGLFAYQVTGDVQICGAEFGDPISAEYPAKVHVWGFDRAGAAYHYVLVFANN